MSVLWKCVRVDVIWVQSDSGGPRIEGAMSMPRVISSVPWRTRAKPPIKTYSTQVREARTRASLTQDELARLSGVARSLIARWKQGSVSPSIDNFLEIIEVCGFELPLVLVERDTNLDSRLDMNRRLSPERRARRHTGKLGKSDTSDA